jgi:hypothetical protein
MRLLDLPDDCLALILQRAAYSGRSALDLKHVCSRFARLLRVGDLRYVESERRIDFDVCSLLSSATGHRATVNNGLWSGNASVVPLSLTAQQVIVFFERRSAYGTMSGAMTVYVNVDGRWHIDQVVHLPRLFADPPIRPYIATALQTAVQFKGTIVMLRFTGHFMVPHTEASYNVELRCRLLLCDPTLVGAQLARVTDLTLL